MITLTFAFLISTLLVLLLIRYQQTHQHISLDSELNAIQKFHAVPVPRIGGLGVFIGCVSALCIKKFLDGTYNSFPLLLVAVASPTFLIGLLEDVTKKISVSQRLTVTALSAGVGVLFLDIRLTHLDVVMVDSLLLFFWVSVVVTCFAVSGVANAFNLIDGFNGLSAGVASIILFGLLYVAHGLLDQDIVIISLSLLGAVLGFALWNYPRGLIFLGDGGAYFIGFMIAELSVWIVKRHSEVSPWFPLLLVYYPIVETIFTIFRRRFIKRVSIGAPDASHLHQLIHRRLIKTKFETNQSIDIRISQNSATSPYLWLMCLLSVIPAVLFYRNTQALMLCTFVYSVFYVVVYQGMTRRRLPRWLMIHKNKN
ncbi:MAG: glycosyltransferase family 4 protein [Betaproteobacteria bacterium]|nr:glycosyltransferase family 4 protein [Betaproteobacteria bacterium]